MNSKNFGILGKRTRFAITWGILFSFAFSPLIYAQETSQNASSPASAALPPASFKLDPVEVLKAACLDVKNGQTDDALVKVNGLIDSHSQNKAAHLLRAMIYAGDQQWDQADADYNFVLALDPQNVAVKFDSAELKFMQKKYDEARGIFAELQGNENLGDFATYKVFLCDLFGKHEDAATVELKAINDVGGNPSYYFANAAWDLVHGKPEDAADWLSSAGRIYAQAPQKYLKYASSLRDLGYLPLHLSSTQ
jgi:predicted Zn-dependent protease